jgi:hypothetical protein
MKQQLKPAACYLQTYCKNGKDLLLPVTTYQKERGRMAMGLRSIKDRGVLP